MPIYFTSVEHRYCYVNRVWEKIAHVKRDLAIGRSIDQIFPSETSRQFMDINNQVISGALPLVVDEFLETPSGRRFYHTVKFPLCKDSGKVELVGGVSVEIPATAEAELPRKPADPDRGWDSAISRIGQIIASTVRAGRIDAPLPPYIDGMAVPGPGPNRPAQNRNFDVLNLRSYLLSLTSREIQIVNLIKFGKTSKEIADTLNISVRTVESHRENIRKKFGFNNKHANLASFLVFLKEEIPSVLSPP